MNSNPDIAVVTGTMGNQDITVTVTYSENINTLTVKYVSVTDGREVAEPKVKNSLEICILSL
jgi:hypothetical protein